MPAKPSGEVKVKTVKMRQKNGDIYILERRTIYDPEKKYNRVLGTKLIAKIPKGQENPVPTRQKRPKEHDLTLKNKKVDATRKHIGMMDIIEHIGQASGIDAGIYASTDKPTAQKILSLARYLLATNGQSLPGIQTWQYSHPIPYAEGISEGVYHDLFQRVGTDEALQQSFFLSRCERLGKNDTIAYDSTTISTYSENQTEARYGFNKAHDGLKTVKLLTLYSIETRQPIAFTKQPGNLPDVITVANAIRQLEVLGVKAAELVTDNGYFSASNLSEMFHEGFRFITLVKTSLTWVQQELDGHMEELSAIESTCPFDVGTHGVTVMMMREFERARKYASHKKGSKSGDMEKFRRRLYLHLYFNPMRQAEERAAFETDLMELKRLIEAGTPVEELSREAQSKAGKYLSLRHWGEKVTVSFNSKACAEAYRYHGYFALVASRESDTFQCLLKYRRRERIESFFESGKQRMDGSRLRVWDADTLRGRMFVQFVSLCYYEYLSEELRKIKRSLGNPEGREEESLDKAQLDDEKKLKAWMDNTPLYLQLQWFDTVENVEVSYQLRAKRWSTEITARDRLYLERLGVKIE